MFFFIQLGELLTYCSLYILLFACISLSLTCFGYILIPNCFLGEISGWILISFLLWNFFFPIYLGNHLRNQEVKEHRLYSLCYMHVGEPRVWYSIPGRFAADFETVRKEHLPVLFAKQPDSHDTLVSLIRESVMKILLILEQ